MENIGMGAGLAAIGFWTFVAVVVVAGIWDNVRKREAKHETLRRMIEGGEKLDRDLMNKLLAISNESSENLGRDLKVSGLIMIFIAPGLAAFSLFLGKLSAEAETALLGVSVLVGLIAIGLMVAGKAAEKWDQRHGGSNFDQSSNSN